MNTTVPHYMDPLKHLGSHISGVLDATTLRRWQIAPDCVPNNTTKNVVQVDLQVQREGQYTVISGRLETNVALVCQRCLAVMNYCIDVPVRWSPVSGAVQARSLPDGLEPIQETKGVVDVYWQIEDQLLLELPSAPKHPSPEHCEQNDVLGLVLRTDAASTSVHPV